MPIRTFPRRQALVLSLAALAGGLARAEAGDAPVQVVASFSILADFVRQVGGDRVRVVALVGPNGDVHAFEPSPADAARVAAARLVVVNGLGLEGWLERLVRASGGKAATLVASRGVKPIREAAPDGGHPGQATSRRLDPHAFGSPVNAKIYVANIRDALVTADPDGRAAYEANAGRYLAELDRLDLDVRAQLARLPAGRRKAITTHDAFRYFAEAYGMRFIAPKGVSTESEISARDVAAIVRQIRQEAVPAVFLENVSDPRLMERIAQESGARIGGKLYSDALSEPAGPAATYLDLVRHNVRTLAGALAP